MVTQEYVVQFLHIMIFLIFLTLLISGVTHSGQKNVWCNVNFFKHVLCEPTQMSILDKALWYVLEKNMCSLASQWNVLDMSVRFIESILLFMSSVLILGYWSGSFIPCWDHITEIFCSISPSSTYFTHWILWCWVHTELCPPIELIYSSFNTAFTSCEGFHTTVCSFWCKCGHPYCLWLPLAWNMFSPFLSLCILKSAASVGTQHRVDLGCLQIHSATLCFLVLMRLIFYMQSDYW